MSESFPLFQDPSLKQILKLLKNGNLDTARRQCYSILLQDNQNTSVLFLLGVIAEKKGEIESAVKYLKKSIVANSNNLEKHNYLGQTLEKQGAISEAIAVYRYSLSKNPSQVQILAKLANLLQSGGSFDLAIYYYQRAIEIDPSCHTNYNGLGLTLQKKGMQNEAIKVFQRSIAINPQIADSYYNLCGALLIQGRATDAVKVYQTAVSIIPDSAKLRFFYGQSLLLIGDFATGWVQYEARVELESFKLYKDIPLLPKVDDSRQKKQSICVYADQGIGDAIQFLRFLPQIAQLGARIGLVCQKELLPLIEQNQIELNIKSVYALDSTLNKKEFDYCLPLSSLAYYLGINEENHFTPRIPYISSARCHSHCQLEISKFRVGLVWAGNPKHVNDQFRSISLQHFATFSDLSECQFYSLQVGAKANQLKTLQPNFPIIDLSQYLRNFADTASVIDQLDLLISVDTSVAHLAGAMGKSVWVLIPSKPDWRWQLDRSDSPWYPSLRLFRQKKIGLWSDVLDEIKAQLLILMQTHQAQFRT